MPQLFCSCLYAIPMQPRYFLQFFITHGNILFSIARGEARLALTSKTNALFTAEVASSDISPHIEGLDTAFS